MLRAEQLANEPALQHYHNAHRKGLGLPGLEVITNG